MMMDLICPVVLYIMYIAMKPSISREQREQLLNSLGSSRCHGRRGRREAVAQGAGKVSPFSNLFPLLYWKQKNFSEVAERLSGH